MTEFWVSSGHHLTQRDAGGGLAVTDELILADEPTGNLDPETADRSLGLLLEAARTRGAAVLLVTHSARAAEAADRTLFLGRQGLDARHGA